MGEASRKGNEGQPTSSWKRGTVSEVALYCGSGNENLMPRSGFGRDYFNLAQLLHRLRYVPYFDFPDGLEHIAFSVSPIKTLR